MSYLCNVCDKTKKLKFKKKHLKSFSDQDFDKCKHTKLTIENPHMKKMENTVYGYLIQHNKKYDNYLIKCDSKLVFDNSEFSPQITSKLFDKKINNFLVKFFG